MQRTELIVQGIERTRQQSQMVYKNRDSGPVELVDLFARAERAINCRCVLSGTHGRPNPNRFAGRLPPPGPGRCHRPQRRQQAGHEPTPAYPQRRYVQNGRQLHIYGRSHIPQHTATVVGLGTLSSLVHFATTFPDFLPRICIEFYATLKGDTTHRRGGLRAGTEGGGRGANCSEKETSISPTPAIDRPSSSAAAPLEAAGTCHRTEYRRQALLRPTPGRAVPKR